MMMQFKVKVKIYAILHQRSQTNSGPEDLTPLTYTHIQDVRHSLCICFLYFSLTNKHGGSYLSGPCPGLSLSQYQCWLQWWGLFSLPAWPCSYTLFLPSICGRPARLPLTKKIFMLWTGCKRMFWRLSIWPFTTFYSYVYSKLNQAATYGYIFLEFHTYEQQQESVMTEQSAYLISFHYRIRNPTKCAS